LYNFA